jgi:SAM-dependent methyltransferase
MILSDLMEYLPEDAAVLEIGCGIGRLLAPMCERFPEVWGGDVSGEMIAQAARRLGQRPGLHLIENSGKDIAAVPDGHFNLCFSMQVLECAPTVAGGKMTRAVAMCFPVLIARMKRSSVQTPLRSPVRSSGVRFAANDTPQGPLHAVR